MELPVGVGPPNTVAITVTTSPDVVGTDVTSGRIEALRPDGATVAWSVTLSGATATTVVATHALVSGDLSQTGAYRLLVYLTAGGVERRAQYPVTLTARAKWAIGSAS